MLLLFLSAGTSVIWTVTAPNVGIWTVVDPLIGTTS